MTPIIAIILTYFIYFILEVYHDDVLRLIRNKGRYLMIKLESASKGRYASGQDIIQDGKWNNEWHALDFVGHLLIASLIGFLMFWFTGRLTTLLIPITIGTMRVLILNIWGNKVAGRKMFYLSNGKWEKWFYGNERLYYFFVMLVFGASIYFLIWDL